MSKWIPEWVKGYKIFHQGEHGTEHLMIEFWADANHKLVKPIEQLAHDLAIADACQQMRDKPLEARVKTLDDAMVEEWDANDSVKVHNPPLRYKPGRCSINVSNDGSTEVRSKYHREIKPGVWVDVYDVLNAFGIKCHALAHAIKKLLMPGERGAKGYKQDCEEAIQSINRSIDTWG